MDKGQYLDSWKDIAAYLKRNIRTCQAWERELGLPVHRLDGSPKPRVFAYSAELDAWRARTGKLSENGESWGDEETANGSGAPATVPIRRFRWVPAALVAGPLLAVSLTAVIVWRLRPAPVPAVVRSTIKLEPGHWLNGLPWRQRPTRTALAISGDGRFIVYSAIPENPDAQAISRLYLRRLDESEAKPISGTEGGISPFLSPDSRWVGFWAGGKLKKIPVEGGVAAELCDVGTMFGADWSQDTGIVFADGEDAGLSRTSAEGGKPETLTRPDPKREEYSHRLPCWLPHGEGVVFTLMRHAVDLRPLACLLRMDTREWRVLLEDATDARYIPSGHLVFLRQGKLMAVRFDPAGLEVVGQPVPLQGGVMQAFHPHTDYHTGAGQFDISDSGSLVYAAGGILPDNLNSLVWVDRDGTEEPAADLKLPFLAVRLSPDGRRIAFSMETISRIQIYDLDKGTHSPLTAEGRANYPVWSPDGRHVLFSWNRSLAENLFRQVGDGSLPMERLTTGEASEWPGSWSPDGRTIALVRWNRETGDDIDLLDVATGRVTPFLDSPFKETFPEFSPDGRWLAYVSDESNRDEVYVRAFPGPGPKIRISHEGGNSPVWSRKGDQIFYRWRARQMWAAAVRTNGGFTAARPRLLFEKLYSGTEPVRGFDISLDSKRFLMVKLEEGRKRAPVTEITLVQNWLEELKRMAPASR